jgi:hypothetical protein
MTTNVFTGVNNLQNTIGPDNYFESRVENDSEGNPLYIAWSPIPNAGESDEVWYIKKLFYDINGFVERVQLPDDGAKFTYAWTDRATYFS